MIEVTVEKLDKLKLLFSNILDLMTDIMFSDIFRDFFDFLVGTIQSVVYVLTN